jgi:site-specific DNA-adenine methylase
LPGVGGKIKECSQLENVSSALSRAIIFAGDYIDAIENAQKGDFIYLDPRMSL